VREREAPALTKPWQRYYMDKYEKCANCGKLLYGEGFTTSLSNVPFRFCSDWCKEWFVSRRDERAAGSEVGAPAQPSTRLPA
jgi:N-methylhydantoinase B